MKGDSLTHNGQAGSSLLGNRAGNKIKQGGGGSLDQDGHKSQSKKAASLKGTLAYFCCHCTILTSTKITSHKHHEENIDCDSNRFQSSDRNRKYRL